MPFPNSSKITTNKKQAEHCTLIPIPFSKHFIAAPTCKNIFGQFIISANGLSNQATHGGLQLQDVDSSLQGLWVHDYLHVQGVFLDNPLDGWIEIYRRVNLDIGGCRFQKLPGRLIHRLLVLNTLNFLTDLKSSKWSLVTWATSSSRSLPWYWIRVPPEKQLELCRKSYQTKNNMANNTFYVGSGKIKMRSLDSQDEFSFINFQ